jgi:nitrite reductase (NADH) large subunit
MTTLMERPGETRAEYHNRRRLVLIGNGMAGARVVEEILARGGATQFSITMFGDEPYGNYNRIMLSHVLSGEESHDDILLNSLEWYIENDILLHAGVRVLRIDRFAQVVFSDDGQITPYDELIIATGSRSFMPPMDGLYMPDGSLLPGVFAFRTIDDTRGMIDYVTRDDHRRAAVIGGGLLGLEAARGLQSHGIDVDVVHSGRWLMNAQLGREGGEVLRRSMAELGIGIFTNNRATTIWGPDKVQGVRLRDESEIDCDLVVVAAGIRPNTDVATTSGFTVERAIVVDDQMRTVDDDHVFAVGECVQHRGEVYGLVAPLWEQAVVLADVITGNNPQAAYLGSRTATKLKVAGVEVAAMGLTEPERDTDEHIVFSEPKRGVFKSVVIRDGKIVGATLLGDSKKLAFLQQAFDRGLPLPEERVELLFDLGGPSRRSRGGRARRRRPDLQLQRSLQVHHRGHRQWRLQDRLRCHGGDPSRKRLWLVQGAGRAIGRIRRRWRRRGRPVGPPLRAGHPHGQARIGASHSHSRPPFRDRGLCSPCA